MENHKYAVVDIETTGHSSSGGDRIIQLAIVFIENNQVTNTYSTFINPEQKIPLFIQDLTHIQDKDVKDAPTFEEVAPNVLNMLQDTIFVAHNIHFDLSFIQKELQRVGLPKLVCKTIDTVEFVKLMYPNLYSFKLQDIAIELGISLESAHRADDDALATAHLLLKCYARLLELPLKTIELLHKRSFSLKSNLSFLFYEVLNQKRRDVDTFDYELYKGMPLRKISSPLPFAQEELIFPTTIKNKNELLKRGFSHFEERPGQFDFMDKVYEAFSNRQEIVCEAETGIGKTLAYLLPAILYGIQEKKPVIISTYTTHLIDQLIQDEIPKLELMLGMNLQVAKLQGIHHYIDLNRFSEHLHGEDESYDETFTIMQVLVWLTLTDEGDLSELNVSGGGQLFLDKIRRTADQLPLDGRELDYYHRAVQKSRNCHVLITNHAMIMADKDRENKLLAHGCGTIIDEAHQMITASMAKNERIFSYTNWKYVLGQFGTLDTEQLLNRLSMLNVSLTNRIKLEKLLFHVVESFDVAISYVLQAVQTIPFSNKHTKKSFVLEDLLLNKSAFQRVSTHIQDFIDLSKAILQAHSSFSDDKEEMVLKHEWDFWLRELEIKVSEWDEIFLVDIPLEAKWLELDTRSIPGSLTVIKKPLNYQAAIKDAVDGFRQNGGIVWTSGTLTVPNNQHFITAQLGLGAEIPVYHFVASPDFYQGAELLIIEDMPDIQQVSQSDYIESVAEAIVQTVLVTEGRCFVLFTSQEMLRRTVELIQETELLDEYMLFAQGITSGSRMRLLKSFQRFSKSILFGTNSFWEGVDVPGDALSVVIMVRLPFSSPDDPLYRKRSELLTQNGENAFTAYSLPEAILRFRQGFGRLIRSASDKGVFIVLDRRIETKSYGSEFLQAIPNIPVKKVSLENIVLELENWYTN